MGGCRGTIFHRRAGCIRALQEEDADCARIVGEMGRSKYDQVAAVHKLWPSCEKSSIRARRFRVLEALADTPECTARLAQEGRRGHRSRRRHKEEAAGQAEL